MKSGWINIAEELPPIGLVVIFSFANIAYGNHFTVCKGKRVNAKQIIGFSGIILSVKRGKMFFDLWANYWAYDNNQELPNICDCLWCESEHKNK